MTLLRTLLESLGNGGALANARQEHDRARREDELIAALVHHVGPPTGERQVSAA